MHHVLSKLGVLAGRITIGWDKADLVVAQVAHSRRCEFLPLHFGVHLMAPVQTSVFDWMERLAPTCPGGLWHFIEISNGGAYLMPAWADRLPVRLDAAGINQVMTADAAGITVTLLALMGLVWQGHDSLLLKYDQLLALATQHEEGRVIKQAVCDEGVVL